MKKNFSIKIAVLFLFVIVAFAGCQKDSSVTTSTAERDKFVGSWNCTTTGPLGPLTYTLTITAGNSSPDQIILRNFETSGYNSQIIATVSGSSFTMSTTQIGSDRYTGGGSIASNIISLTFSVDDGQNIENRTGTAHK